MECVYKCYLCSKEFKDESIIVSHIKFNHFIKENTVEMKCLVKGNSCADGFYTFASLKSHLKKCPWKGTTNRKVRSDSNECDVKDYLVVNDQKLVADEKITYNQIENRDNYFTFDGMIPPESSSPEHQRSVSDNVDGTFFDEYGQTNKFDELMMDSFLSSMIIQIGNLKMTQEQTTTIYNLCLQLTENAHKFTKYLIEEDNGFDAQSALLVSSKTINNRLAECSTVFKRNKCFNANPLYVAAQEFGVGVRFNMSRADQSCVAVPRLIQCKFHYIPITETIVSLFQREDFRKAYFEYNSSIQERERTGKFEMGFTTFHYSISLIEIFLNGLIIQFFGYRILHRFCIW